MTEDDGATVRQWTDVVRRARLGRTTKLVAFLIANYADSNGTRVFPGIARLSIEAELTYNVVQVTYNGFCDMIPTLSEAQKEYILAQLKEARELAIDGGSSQEKHAIFGKFKGRINNYLSKEGYDLKKANEEWAERRKAREGAKTTQPAS